MNLQEKQFIDGNFEELQNNLNSFSDEIKEIKKSYKVFRIISITLFIVIFISLIAFAIEGFKVLWG